MVAPIEAGKAALAGRRTATIQRAEVRLTINEWKDEANAVRVSVYGRLLDLRKADEAKAFADRFFRSYARPAENGNGIGVEGGQPENEAPIEG